MFTMPYCSKIVNRRHLFSAPDSHNLSVAYSDQLPCSSNAFPKSLPIFDQRSIIILSKMIPIVGSTSDTSTVSGLTGTATRIKGRHEILGRSILKKRLLFTQSCIRQKTNVIG